MPGDAREHVRYAHTEATPHFSIMFNSTAGTMHAQAWGVRYKSGCEQDEGIPRDCTGAWRLLLRGRCETNAMFERLDEAVKGRFLE